MSCQPLRKPGSLGMGFATTTTVFSNQGLADELRWEVKGESGTGAKSA